MYQRLLVGVSLARGVLLRAEPRRANDFAWVTKEPTQAQRSREVRLLANLMLKRRICLARKSLRPWTRVRSIRFNSMGVSMVSEPGCTLYCTAESDLQVPMCRSTFFVGHFILVAYVKRSEEGSSRLRMLPYFITWKCPVYIVTPCQCDDTCNSLVTMQMMMCLQTDQAPQISEEIRETGKHSRVIADASEQPSADLPCLTQRVLIT